MAISFQGAGNTANYFRGSGEQAHSQFGDLVSTAKKVKYIYIYIYIKSHLKGKASIF